MSQEDQDLAELCDFGRALLETARASFDAYQPYLRLDAYEIAFVEDSFLDLEQACNECDRAGILRGIEELEALPWFLMGRGTD